MKSAQRHPIARFRLGLVFTDATVTPLQGHAFNSWPDEQGSCLVFVLSATAAPVGLRALVYSSCANVSVISACQAGVAVGQMGLAVRCTDLFAQPKSGTSGTPSVRFLQQLRIMSSRWDQEPLPDDDVLREQLDLTPQERVRGNRVSSC